MKPTPKGWPRISPSLFYEDAQHAIDWLGRAFGFEVRLKVEGEGGKVVHSELVFGEGLIMVSDVRPPTGAADAWRADFSAPSRLGGKNTQTLAVYVDDADAHCARARAEGAEIFAEPSTHDYGDDYWADRTYGARDPGGHQWWFMQRVRG